MSGEVGLGGECMEPCVCASGCCDGCDEEGRTGNAGVGALCLILDTGTPEPFREGGGLLLWTGLHEFISASVGLDSERNSVSSFWR